MHLSSRLFALTCAVLCTFCQSSLAQIPEAEYAQRRVAVAEAMGPGVLIAFGAKDYVGPRPSQGQLPSFEYLTGFHQADAVFVMRHQNGVVRSSLFTVVPGIRRQFYDGFPEGREAIEHRTGMTVQPLSALTAHVDSLVASGVKLYEIRDFESEDYAARDTLTRGRFFIDGLQDRHPEVTVEDAYPIVRRLRARKSPAEIDLLRTAVRITDEAHHAALKVVRPGAWEYEVEAAIEATFRSRGGEGPSFSSIVGSGPNSTTLHYRENDRRMMAGDVIVMDIGAEYHGYDGDVTRTVPVSGRFTPEQRRIYDLVLAAQKAAEAAAEPGGEASASLVASIRVRMDGLAQLGLIQHADSTFDPPWPVNCSARPDQCRQGNLFMIHGISHGIGLEVHDPAQFYFDGRYGVGDVFTIEPGIYVNSRALEMLPDTPKNRAFVDAVRDVVARYDEIGVRIEDDYLMTDDGLERLSGHAPREADEIEAAMAASR